MKLVNMQTFPDIVAIIFDILQYDTICSAINKNEHCFQQYINE